MTRRVTDIVDEGEVLGVVGGVLASVPLGDDQTAAEVAVTPAGSISATDVQAALVELDTEKATAAQGALADSAVQPGDDAADLGSGAAADGFVLTADGAGGAAWEAASGGGGGTTVYVMHVRDEKASGTGGGTSTAGSWQTRTLNTVVTNTISGASLASNQITLPAGSYEVWGRSPIYKGGFHKCRLYNVTASALLIAGSSSFIGNAIEGQTDSTVQGVFTLAGATVVRLEYRCLTAQTTSGLGGATSFGDVEVYADLMIRKVA